MVLAKCSMIPVLWFFLVNHFNTSENNKKEWISQTQSVLRSRKKSIALTHKKWEYAVKPFLWTPEMPWFSVFCHLWRHRPGGTPKYKSCFFLSLFACFLCIISMFSWLPALLRSLPKMHGKSLTIQGKLKEQNCFFRGNSFYFFEAIKRVSNRI